MPFRKKLYDRGYNEVNLQKTVRFCLKCSLVFHIVLLTMKKSKTESARKAATKTAISRIASGGQAQPPGPQGEPADEYPDPEVVVAAAKQEVKAKLIEDYIEAIRVLKDDKDFSYREIAAWLKDKFGIEADHNAVYRAYTKGMDDVEVAIREDEERRREEDEAETQ